MVEEKKAGNDVPSPIENTAEKKTKQGHRLAQQIARERKETRWTWESASGEYHNEIEPILVNRTFCLTDIAVVSKFYTEQTIASMHNVSFFVERRERH
ncbi:hypothetical protein KIN20_002118 [Parelaphostrongylus tenuis]|uniref:Uncharacterized protein n=1 Tax=Parelaphostrongylus tenuis TaxID=148309 RepID=A0AAD5QCT5_PARTN|nr:hypothetical protein KIN20_002118 [Parelaphostrongylus tenuis]